MIPDFDRITSYFPLPSRIADHGAPCCRTALAWLRGVDATNSYVNGSWHPPTWLRKKYEWGPAQCPLFWCSLPDAQTLECGGLAATAVQLYRLRGQSVAHVQLVVRYPSQATEQWSRMWQRAGQDSKWILGNLCYHEACGVLEGTRIKLWDPTKNRWLEPPSSPAEAFASVVALRVFEPSGRTASRVDWEGISIRAGAWQVLLLDDEGRLTN